MTLSSNVRYTLVAVTILATKQPRSGALARAPFTNLSELHQALGLSVSYLEQLMKRLRDAELVVARTGPKGGYRLSHRASRITLGSVARAVETYGVRAVGGEPQDIADRLNGRFDAFLDSVSVADVASTRLAEGDA